MPYATFLRPYDTILNVCENLIPYYQDRQHGFGASPPPAGVKITLSFHNSETEPLF